MTLTQRLLSPLITSTHAWQRLDFLRLVAACGIVVHHSYEFAIPVNIRSEFMHRTEGLAIFVDLFFCISGFTIASMYSGRMSRPSDYIRFISRRISRLIPLHWLTFLISALFWIIIVKAGIHSDHIPTLSASCTLRTLFLVHGIYVCQAVNSVSWSISAEMVFYILFPLIALLARPGVRAFTAIAALAAAIIAITLHKNVADWTSLPAVVRGIPSFTIGVLMFNTKTQIAKLKINDRWLYISLLLTVLSMITSTPPYITIILCYTTIVAAISGDLSKAPTRILKILSPGAILTYSIYMWHSIFIIAIPNAVGDKILHLTPLPMSILLILTYAIIFIASLASYTYWEEPLRRIINDTYDRKIREMQ